MTEEELGFAKKFTKAPLTLSAPTLALEKPLEGIESLMRFHAKAENNLAKLIQVASEDGFGDTFTSLLSVSTTEVPFTLAIPESLRQAVGDIAASQISANAAIKDATSKLTPEEKRQLIESLPQWATIGTDIKFDFVKQPRLGKGELYNLLAKVDLARIRLAAYELTKSIEEHLPKIRDSIKAGWKGSVKFNLAGLAVELSGVGDDVHESKNSTLCIDLGGKNTYNGRFGAGIGYAGVLIDFGTETKTTGPDASFGAGILGVGAAYFMGPKPNIETESISLGAGLAGVGVCQTAQSATVESKALSQGVGVFGLGIFLGSKGNDQLSISYLGQGAAVGGGLGWNVNPAGNDRYTTKKLIISSVSRNTFLSRSQGYSGVLPGGVGLLTDIEGDDEYSASEDSQGFGTILGCGSIYDLKGSDQYLATSRAQASATLNGCGTLFDLSGNDLHITSGAMVLGGSSESSVAFSLDRGGDDTYVSTSAIAQSKSGSLSFLIDASGVNRYTSEPNSGNDDAYTFFIDLGVDSSFGSKGSTGSILVNRNTSVQIFAPDASSINENGRPITTGTLQATESEIDSWWNLICFNGAKNDRAATQLTAIGEPAFERYVSKFLEQGTSDSNSIAATILSNDGKCMAHFSKAIAAPTARALSNLFEIATLARVSTLKGRLSEGLQNELSAVNAIRYAAYTKSVDQIETISGLVLAGDAFTSQQAVLALSEIGSQGLVSTMEALLDTRDIVARKAALKFLARFPRGFELAKQFLSRQDEASQLKGVEIMSQVDDDDALRLVGSGLNSNFNRVKIKAMNVLNGRVPAAYKPRIVELTNDTNPVVAMIARGVDLGK